MSEVIKKTGSRAQVFLASTVAVLRHIIKRGGFSRYRRLRGGRDEPRPLHTPLHTRRGDVGSLPKSWTFTTKG